MAAGELDAQLMQILRVTTKRQSEQGTINNLSLHSHGCSAIEWPDVTMAQHDITWRTVARAILLLMANIATLSICRENHKALLS